VRTDDAYNSIVSTFSKVTGTSPKLQSQGGNKIEEVGLQNIYNRLKMIMSYLMAQLVPWTKNGQGFLLVLGTTNIDEILRGYYTKYDSSAADLNPIGGINKQDLKNFLEWFGFKTGIEVFREIAKGTPAAQPKSFDKVDNQTFEETDMGITYNELDQLGKARKVYKDGPVSMFERLLFDWPHANPRDVAKKVKTFFTHYSMNRHKATVLPPLYHAENYGADDNRFDLRQILYDTTWEVQFKKIDEMVEALEAKAKL